MVPLAAQKLRRLQLTMTALVDELSVVAVVVVDAPTAVAAAA